MTSPHTFDLAYAASGERIHDVQTEPLGGAPAAATARSLAPAGRSRRAAPRPRASRRAWACSSCWSSRCSTPTRSRRNWETRRDELPAPIGAGSAGPFEIDLRRDGPHALVVGTTGSGKSELLRSIVCSLAALHPPTRVSFLLFDYKGGAAFGPCGGLPHVFDVVSDLDEHLSQRALIALDAELLRRERILADAGRQGHARPRAQVSRSVRRRRSCSRSTSSPSCATRCRSSSTASSTSRSAGAASACT